MVNLHIILDIDQTLIDSMDRNNYIKMSDSLRDPNYYCSENNLVIWRRDNLEKFLNYLDKNVKYISIWTNGTKGWLHYILNNILYRYINPKRFKWLLSRDSSNEIIYNNSPILIKDLSKIIKLQNNKYLTTKNTVLIDDNLHNCLLNKNNTIPIKKFVIELEKKNPKRGEAFNFIIEILQILKKSNDVSLTLNNVYKTMSNYEKLFG